MAYSEKEIEDKFDEIINLICVDGMSLRDSLRQGNMPSSQTFYKWLEDDELKSKRYARACSDRADIIFEQILEIADDQELDVYEKDGVELTNHNVIQRSRLRVDSRKWMLAKMNPKKYGDKIDMTTDGEKITTPTINFTKSE